LIRRWAAALKKVVNGMSLTRDKSSKKGGGRERQIDAGLEGSEA
jgi:hypothetical protein